ncbi:alkylhydroperoxidase [Halobacteriales archaeon SW_8_65_20]|nr:MAG: alkylhydroperoxidase [Halobacteriales archaeon QH_7_65_31]PSQ52469.1 MAG: alkylhydroperoxidase [Halobacteriales archaeon SW_8_65_20]
MSEPMGRFDAPEPETLPDDVRTRIETETEEAGFTPNVFSAFAYKPSHFRAFFEYHDAIIEESAIDRAEIEMLIVTVSGINDCLYCVVAHGALLRLYSGRPKLADQLATNYRSADLSERRRAMLEFAELLTESPGDVDDAAVEALQETGFSKEQVWDIATVVAYYNLSNRLATVADMRPNEEFYQLGRDQNGE